MSETPSGRIHHAIHLSRIYLTTPECILASVEMQCGGLLLLSSSESIPAVNIHTEAEARLVPFRFCIND